MKFPIVIEGDTIPEVWEKSIVDLYFLGKEIDTEYNQSSKDSPCYLTVKFPTVEPMVSKCMPGGLEELVEYQFEVTHGIKDSLADGKDGHWMYTYHDRMVNYNGINQIDYVVDILSNTQHSRRAVITVRDPVKDVKEQYPACMQSLDFKLYDDMLYLTVYFRSNDAYKAAFMNMFALVSLQSLVADRLTEKLGKKIFVGPYTHIASSYHIYENYYNEVEDLFLSNISELMICDNCRDFYISKDFYMINKDQISLSCRTCGKSITRPLKRVFKDRVINTTDQVFIDAKNDVVKKWFKSAMV